MHNFIALYELKKNALLTVHSKMLKYSGNIKKIKMFGGTLNIFP